MHADEGSRPLLRAVTKRRLRCASQAMPLRTSALGHGVSRSMPSRRPCSMTHPVTRPDPGSIRAMHSVIHTFAHTYAATATVSRPSSRKQRQSYRADVSTHGETESK